MSSARRDPVQQRSRDHVEAMLAAAVELLGSEGGLEAITTRAVAQRSGVSVATVYRYFENSDAIVAAVLDRDMELLDATVAAAVLKLKHVTLRTLIETAMLAHLRHHQLQPQLVSAWFGANQSEIVRERVRRQNLRLAQWLQHAFDATGFLRDDVPADGGYMIVRLTDRMIEHVLMELDDSSPATQDSSLRLFADMVCTFAERFATDRAISGVDAEEFLVALSERPVHLDAKPRGRTKR